MYEVYYYSRHNAQPQLIHDGFSNDADKIIDSELQQIMSGIDTFDFDIHMEHSLYNQIEAINGLVRVVNTMDGAVEFFGRVTATEVEMSPQNTYIQHVECEDFKGYFHDSTQPYMVIPNNGAKDLLTKIIANHNASVESHKRFKVGRVTKIATSDKPNRYIGYESTFETINKVLLKQIGGVVRIRLESDGMYVDWLENYGDHVDSPIMVGENMLNASRAIDLTDVITRLVPLGADLEQETPEGEEQDKDAIRQRITIKSVNNGVWYLQDDNLVEAFGIREKEMSWPEIDDAGVLKQRGEQYLNSQQVMLASWEVETAELWLVDDRFKKYEVGNWHPIINQRIGGIEELQIAKKVFSIVDYRRVKIDVGSLAQTLSMYQLQMQEAQKSIERVNSEISSNRAGWQSELSALLQQLDSTSEADAQIISALETRIAQLETLLAQS